MAMLDRPFLLDMIPESTHKVSLLVYVSQYDSDEVLRFQLYTSHGTLTIPSNATARIRGTKLDGNGIDNAATLYWQADGTPVVSVQLTKQMTAIAGYNPFEIIVSVGEYDLPSATFFLVVKRAALDYDTLTSNSDVAEIANVMSQADRLIASAEAIEDAAEKLSDVTQFISDLSDLNTKITTLETDVSGIKQQLKIKVDSGYVGDGTTGESGIAYFVGDGTVLFTITGVGGGGGGGGGSDSTLQVINTTGWTATAVTEGQTVTLSLNWSSTQDGMSTGSGSLRVFVNTVSRMMQAVSQGSVSVDVTRYLESGTNTVTLQITDATGNTRNRAFTIDLISLYLTSTFSPSTYQSGSFNYPFIPYGSVSKTVHFLIDGVTEFTQVTTASGRQLSQAIPAQTHGAHTLKVWITANVAGNVITSSSLFYDIMWVVQGNSTPIITINYAKETVAQYSTEPITYMVYNPASPYAEVDIYLNNVSQGHLTVDRTPQAFIHQYSTAGDQTLRITSGAVSRSLTFTVSELDIDVSAVTDDLVFYLNAQGRSNAEANPGTWSYGGYNCVFENFTWGQADGWLTDAEGNIGCRVKGGSKLHIPFHPFAQDLRITGYTIEIDFSTTEVLNYDQPIIYSLNGGRGINITPQNCQLSSEQSSIGYQYKEDDHVRVSFVIQKTANNRLLMVYINAILSGVIQYAVNDDFEQAIPQDIIVDSTYATVNLYCIRCYEQPLLSTQIVQNWIADTQDGSLLVQRYYDNNVFDEYGSLVINKLPSTLPYMIISCAELPQYKGDKKTVSVTYVNPITPALSFTAEGVQANVQGTSSQFYARKNYKLSYKNGFDMTATATHVAKYSFRSGAVPTNAFTMKADVASSEGCNNTELARLYNDLCPYKTPAQVSNSAIRQGIDGFPIVIFWNNTVNETTTFLGKYNFNNDKGTEEVFGFASGDESWEIRNNTSNRVLWKSDDYTSISQDGTYPAWLDDFEARYPDLDPAYTDGTQLQAFASFLKSTDRFQATGAALSPSVTYQTGVDGTGQPVYTTYHYDTAEYRLEKFKQEIGNYCELQSAIFYYLFTETFLMVDSRAKNAFPSFMGSAVSA